MDEYYLPEKSDTFGTFGAEGAEGAEELLALVCFRLGDEQYALDIACVREVLRVPSITHVPQMPDFVLGVVNVRGNILPVFDCRLKFDLAGKAFDDKAKIIVVEAQDASISFIVDELLDNVKVERSSIAPAPYGNLKIPGECVAGISRLDGRVVTILNLNKMYEFILRDITSGLLPLGQRQKNGDGNGQTTKRA